MLNISEYVDDGVEQQQKDSELVKRVKIWYLHVPYYFLLLPINA